MNTVYVKDWFIFLGELLIPDHVRTAPYMTSLSILVEVTLLTAIFERNWYGHMQPLRFRCREFPDGLMVKYTIDHVAVNKPVWI